MYNQTIHRDRKHISCYYWQVFTTAQILKKHVCFENCFEINGKQIIKMAKKEKLLNLKITQEKYNHHF